MAGDGRLMPRVSRSSLKRTACDKCRSRKLRCLRDEQNDNDTLRACRRCANAGIVCVTSPAKPLGRHSARRIRIPSDDASLLTSPRSGAVPPGVHQQEPMEGIRVYTLASSSGIGLSKSENGLRLSSSSQIDDLQATTLGESSLSENVGFDIPAHRTELASDFMSNHTLSPLDICRKAVDSQLKYSRIELPAKSGSQTSSFQRPSPQAEGDNHFGIPDSETIDIQSCRLSLTLSQQMLALGTAPPELDKKLRTSILNANVSLLGSKQRLQAAQTRPVDLVLDSSSQFLDILHQCSQDSGKTDKTTIEPGDKGLQKTQERTEAHGPSQRAEPWIFHAFMPKASQTASESSANSAFLMRKTAQSLSTSSILSLTSCYINFIAIYDILVQQMHRALCDTSPSSPNRGLKLAGFLMHKNGLQVKIPVQVMEHQLELIEQGLGLPNQYRVRPRSYQLPKRANAQEMLEGKGIFDGFEAKALLESAMRLNDQAAVRRILSLRQNLDKVLELTKTLQ
ncbi:hypothetical protein J7T55_002131 [Diaporthe amygdali]|uniref:uncharacterized protein n=1 Tax=Phomopsis amygdali TaxID=1214568 RepID=UPI0022FEF1C4|nr:uncharacterized protein J7T55_002131 [Diaporthe amygdali]KAJ0108527.1 hypothetical protein J7T55_002131 [Diaporthe amygdali]